MRRRSRKSTGIEIYRACDEDAPAGADTSGPEFVSALAHTGIRTRPLLVTGAGQPSGVAVVRLLAGSGHQVVAVDHDPFAAGMRLAHWGAVVPDACDTDFAATLAQVAKRTGARMLIPGDAGEIPALQRSSDVLAQAGLRTWFPEPDVVSVFRDPWRVHETLSALSLPVTGAAPNSPEGVEGPWKVTSRSDPEKSFHSDLRGLVRQACAQIGDALVSHSPAGRRFCADLLADQTHSLVACVAYWHLRSSAFISAAETFTSDVITSLAASVCSEIHMQGPATLAGVVRDDDAVVITDLNLGFSACTPLCTAAGANLVLAYANAIGGDDLPDSPMQYRSGVRMVRHLDEVFET
ncbi:MAG: hypothetical protein WAM97_03715 [Acidimicrobiales bacterium]|jgi:carbamoyl-phosphate synthase large subunit